MQNNALVAGKKLGTGAAIIFKNTAQRSGLGFGIDIHYATRFYAVMHSFHRYRDILGLQQCLHRHQNLLR